jgi:hypothetical protein
MQISSSNSETNGGARERKERIKGGRKGKRKKKMKKNTQYQEKA